MLPEASLKVFLTASPERRAERRYRELRAKGAQDSYEQVLADIIKRDENDSSRAAAPLKKAEDAVEVDTSELTLEESVERICQMCIRDRAHCVLHMYGGGGRAAFRRGSHGSLHYFVRHERPGAVVNGDELRPIRALAHALPSRLRSVRAAQMCIRDSNMLCYVH